MLNYLIRRILIFIPTLIVISLLAFIISISAPGDPVERLAKTSETEGSAVSQTATTKKIKQEIRHKLGLDLPIFYISIGSLAESDTVFKITDKDHQANLQELTSRYGNWDAVSDYYLHLLKTQNSHLDLDADKIHQNNVILNYDTNGDTIVKFSYSKNEINDAINKSTFEISSMLEISNEVIINSKIDSLNVLYSKYEFMQPVMHEFSETKRTYNTLLESTSKWKIYIPKIMWYGAQNQYHHWLFGNGKERKGVIRGDFGISYIDSQPVSDKIWSKVWVSFTLVMLSVLLAYLISIPVGIYSAYQRNSIFDRTSSVILFILYSMPSFFVGTLLLMLFANPDFLVWFPVSGIQDPAIFEESWPWYKKMAHRWPHIVLPLITYTYGSFAFLSRIMRVGMIDVVGQDYIRTARAKGLDEKTVILKHALRNSLLPIITVFANIFPLAIGGSVIIEYIFSLPGMGLETFNAVLNYDYPMIVTVFTISGFLTMVGYLIADILYAVVDPRISYK